MADLIASLIDDQSLATTVQALAQSSPEADQVLTRLLTYFQHKLQQQQQYHGSSSMGDQPGAKRMRLDESTPLSSSTASPSLAAATSPSSTLQWPPSASQDFGPAIYSTSPLSLLHPFRKKLVLRFHQHNITLAQPSGTSGQVTLAAAPWTALYRVIAVPFLERATKQTALLLFFRHQAVPTPKDAIWVVTVADDGKDFSLTCANEHLGLLGLTSDLRETIPSSGTKKPDAILLALLTRCLEYNHKDNNNAYEIVANPSPTFPNFSAHLKSSQGTIYLLPKGILFAFKKPIIYLPAAKIDAIGFHSIVSRTFDFEIVVSEDASPEDCEGVPPAPNATSSPFSGAGASGVNTKQQRRTVGFGMVDTKEFGKVEDWIKRSGIRDRSMSEDLKAKDKAPVSSKKRERKDGDDEDEDETGEEQEGQGNEAKKLAINGSGLDKGKAVASQDYDSDDEDDEDFAPESEDEDMIEEYDSEAVGTDNDDEEMVPAAAATATASAAASGSSRHRARLEEDDGESLGEDTDEDEEEDDELEEEEEEEDDEVEDEEEKDVDSDDEHDVEDEDEEATSKDKGGNASVDLGSEGDDEDEGTKELADDEEELHSEEADEMEEDDVDEEEEEEDEIDELEED